MFYLDSIYYANKHFGMCKQKILCIRTPHCYFARYLTYCFSLDYILMHEITIGVLRCPIQKLSFNGGQGHGFLYISYLTAAYSIKVALSSCCSKLLLVLYYMFSFIITLDSFRRGKITRCADKNGSKNAALVDK